MNTSNDFENTVNIENDDAMESVIEETVFYNSSHSLSVSEDHLILVKYCEKVYKDDYLEDADEFVDNKETGCQCIMFKDASRDRIVVCFRGSDSATDWKYNFYMTTTEYPKKSGRNVHSGFQVQWLSVKNEVKRELEKLIGLHNTTKITFCGHSAGTICCIAAYDLGEELGVNQEIDVVTFGSPRFCDEAFQKYFNSRYKCTRIVLDRDVITLCPFGVFGYHHVGNLIQITDNRIIRKELTLWQKVSWFLLGLPKIDFGIRDHFIFNYKDEIAKLCRK